MIVQLQVLDHGTAEPADGVGDPGGGEPGRELPAAEDAADLIRTFQDRHPAAVLREQRGRHQPVVARADHDDVRAGGHPYAALPPRPRPSTSSAAIRPGAPMIPPPGCVADPHIHRSRIGVR